MIKNLSILILKYFFLGLTSMWEARQGISHNISFSLIIIDSKVVLREFLGPANLIRAQAFCIYELTGVVIVSKDKNFVFAAFQVVAPSFKGLNNGQELLILSFIPNLSGDLF